MQYNKTAADGDTNLKDFNIPSIRNQHTRFPFDVSPFTIHALTTSHAIAAVEAFVAGTATDGDMTAGVTTWRITLHILRSCIHCIQPCF